MSVRSRLFGKLNSLGCTPRIQYTTAFPSLSSSLPCNITVTRKDNAEGKPEDHLYFHTEPAPVEPSPVLPEKVGSKV